MEGEQLVYARGVLSAEQIQSEIVRFWDDLATNPEAEAELRASGFDSRIIADTSQRDAITVRVDASGADPMSALLIIAFAPAGNRVLKDLWATVLLPRIRRRWGDDAIGGENHGAGR